MLVDTTTLQRATGGVLAGLLWLLSPIAAPADDRIRTSSEARTAADDLVLDFATVGTLSPALSSDPDRVADIARSMAEASDLMGRISRALPAEEGRPTERTRAAYQRAVRLFHRIRHTIVEEAMAGELSIEGFTDAELTTFERLDAHLRRLDAYFFPDHSL